MYNALERQRDKGYIMKQLAHNENHLLTKLITLICLVGLIITLILLFTKPVNVQQGFFLVFFSALTLLLLSLRKIAFMAMFLMSTFTLIAAWRLSALAGYTALTWIYTVAMLFKLVNYLLFAYQSIHQARNTPASAHHHQTTAFEWQLLFIRLFIGFDLIPHFCEKLFAGPAIRADDIHAFAQLGVPHPLLMVIIAGVIELAGAFAISCGFITRLGSISLAIYLMIATYLGHHFTNGFIWASPGGGWEYPVLWTALILSFSVFGAGDFSLDRSLKNAYTLPNWLKHLMGGRFT